MNLSRDVVGLVPIDPGENSPREVLVRLCQLRKGIYMGERDFQYKLPAGLTEEVREMTQLAQCDHRMETVLIP